VSSAELQDLRVCMACGEKGTGYTFVATCQGVDPAVCMTCKAPRFKLWSDHFESPEEALKYVVPDRNAPCLCSSGKKFKKCCGAAGP
jgi:uncharacterized protein YchJ